MGEKKRPLRRTPQHHDGHGRIHRPAGRASRTLQPRSHDPHETNPVEGNGTLGPLTAGKGGPERKARAKRFLKSGNTETQEKIKEAARWPPLTYRSSYW